MMKKVAERKHSRERKYNKKKKKTRNEIESNIKQKKEKDLFSLSFFRFFVKKEKYNLVGIFSTCDPISSSSSFNSFLLQCRI